MIDSIKKAILAGVGAAALTKEKAEEALNDLVEKGKISTTEAKETAKKIADDGKQEFEEASTKVQEKFDELLDKMGRKHAERIKELETAVVALETRVAKLEDSGSKTSKSK